MSVAELEERVETALTLAQKAEHKANGAYGHALDLHENLGKVYRLVESIRIRLNDVDGRLKDITNRLGDFRSKLDSVPELVDDTIVEHNLKEDAKTYRNIKAFFKTTAGSLISKGAIGLVGLGLGYLAHRLGILK
jgi:hypothetical protein